MISRMMMMRSVPSPMYMGLLYPRGGRLTPGRCAPGPARGPRSSLCRLQPAVVAVLDVGVPRRRDVAADDLAGAIGVVRGRVLDHVLEVEDRLVGARPAADDVGLAVADRDAVVAVAAADGVARGVVRTVDVALREREQPVVAVPALGRVAPHIGEDDVIPRPAVLVVVARAAGHEVPPVAARRGVVAGAG